MLFTSLFLLAELFATLDTHSCINDTCAHATTILRTVQPLARAEVEFLSPREEGQEFPTPSLYACVIN